MRMRESVQEAIDAARLDDSDQAVAELALTYAAHIDASLDLAKLGPPLLAALEALRLSPRARAAAVKGGTDDQPAGNALDQLAAARARKSRAEDLDTTAS